MSDWIRDAREGLDQGIVVEEMKKQLTLTELALFRFSVRQARFIYGGVKVSFSFVGLGGHSED